MSISTKNRRFSYLGTLAVGVISLAALAIPLTAAKAQGYVGFQFGPFGFGFGALAPTYAYPYYAPAYPHGYYTPRYYYPGYYYPGY